MELASRADDMLPSLPMDVISEILSRTPVKSACRFRCVSKAWHALISDPAFLATHREPSHLIVANSTSDAAYGSIDWCCRDLRLMDLNGNIVRVMKRAGTFLMTGSGAVDGPTCITTNGSVVSLIDLATGNVRATSLAQEEGRRGYEDFIFGVGCAVPSGKYKDGFPCNTAHLQCPHVGGCRRRVETGTIVSSPSLFGLSPKECFTHLWLLDDSVESTWVKTYTIPMAPTTRAEVPLRMMRDSGKLLVYCAPSPYSSTAIPMLQVYDPLTGSRTHLVTFRDQGREDAVGICLIDLKYVVSPVVEHEEFNRSLI
ncbi:hypothetical protein BRADI_2g15990v3 [Brachypodium distachyon]|uniref:F-box domain-containing protein n=1 Tax=Brachypodium distachyon TaxID=15368 RepID=I1HG90_BRADI|nr:hypothetical protein BRADI_2g15990v3 [Brachypodium distachyon]